MNCGLCGSGGAQGALAFLCRVPASPHVSSLPTKGHREPHTVQLDEPLCERCGQRLYKHLKRALPKRLFRIEG